MAVSPDGQHVAQYGWGLFVWPPDSLIPRVAIKMRTRAVTFPHTGGLLAYCSVPRKLRWWSLSGGDQSVDQRFQFVNAEAIHSLRGHDFTPTGDAIASSLTVSTPHAKRSSSVIVIHDSKSHQQRTRLESQVITPTANRMTFSPDGRFLVGLHGSLLTVWELSTSTEVVRHRTGYKHFTKAVFTPDGSRLLTASNDESIRVWAAPNWAEATGYAWKIGKLGCVAVSADGTLAAAGGSTGKVVVWDLE